MSRRKAMSGFAALMTLMLGCSQEVAVPDAASSPPPDGDRYLLSAEPAGAKSVIEIRKNAGDEEDVVIVGRIGGSTNPWVEDRAAFFIVDESLRACSDIEGDQCPRPWDYCCETDKLPAAKVLVRVVDESGELIKYDAKKLLHLKELETVVIRGQARRDDVGNLTVMASGLFVRRQ